MYIVEHVKKFYVDFQPFILNEPLNINKKDFKILKVLIQPF